MLADNDRQETEEDLQWAVEVLRSARARFMDLGELGAPEPGSILLGDRRATAYEPIHTIALRQRHRAVDNLGRTLDLMINDQGDQVQAFTYSLYSLIRAAIESAALALWLLKPQTKSTRVLRALQLTYRDTTERLQFVELIATTEEIAEERRRHDAVIARLTELKNSVGPLQQRTLSGPPKYGTILQSISEHTTTNGRLRYELMSPLMIWKISTAFIHGSDQVTRALSDFRQLSEFDDGIAQIEVTPSLRLLAGSIHATVGLVSRVDERYIDLATHDYGGRSVV